MKQNDDLERRLPNSTMGITESLARLRLEPLELGRNLLAKPIPSSLYKPFADTPVRLLEQLNRPITTKSLLNIVDVRRRWQALDFSLVDLNLAEIRCLCSNMETAVAPQLITGLAQDPRLSRRATWLMGLVNAYYTKWSSIPERQQMEGLLVRSFTAYDGRSQLLRSIKAHAPMLFAPSAGRFLADTSVAELVDVGTVLKRYGLPQTGDLPTKARATLATSWMVRFKSADTENSAKLLLLYLLNTVLSNVAPSPEFYQAIEVVIQSKYASSPGHFRETVQRYALSSKNLGDPRLPAHQAKWAPIPSARRTLLSWLARESLLFFFDLILPNNNENRQRKDFWLTYLRHIVDFQVAVSEKDLSRLMARTQDLPGYSRIDHPTTSAFLMKFEGSPDMIVIEFSETGNAAYIHNAQVFETKVANLHQYKFRHKDELKHLGKKDRIIHLPPNSWQWKARNQLAAWGIRP